MNCKHCDQALFALRPSSDRTGSCDLLSEASRHLGLVVLWRDKGKCRESALPTAAASNIVENAQGAPLHSYTHVCSLSSRSSLNSAALGFREREMASSVTVSFPSGKSERRSVINGAGELLGTSPFALGKHMSALR